MNAGFTHYLRQCRSGLPMTTEQLRSYQPAIGMPPEQNQSLSSQEKMFSGSQSTHTQQYPKRTQRKDPF